jgi:hypothetical protein
MNKQCVKLYHICPLNASDGAGKNQPGRQPPRKPIGTCVGSDVIDDSERAAEDVPGNFDASRVKRPGITFAKLRAKD